MNVTAEATTANQSDEEDWSWLHYLWQFWTREKWIRKQPRAQPEAGGNVGTAQPVLRGNAELTQTTVSTKKHINKYCKKSTG